MVSVGDLVLDITIVPDRRLRPDDDTPATIRVGGGGQAANFCAWAASLGAPARLVCRVGEDDTGARLVTELEESGVEVRAVRGAEPTGVIAVMVGPGGERTMATQRGASIGLRADEISAAWLEDAKLLHVPAYSLFVEPLAGAAAAAVGLARERGAAVAVDLSSAAGLAEFGPARMVAILRRIRADFVFATVAEADVLGVEIEELAPHAVLKLGEAGCQVDHRRITAPPVDVVDPTGAGDALAAAYCTAVLAGADAVQAAEQAVMVASRAVTVAGARPPRRERAPVR